MCISGCSWGSCFDCRNLPGLLPSFTFKKPGGRPELRLVVVSPFLNRQHGTELCIIEQIERLARLPGWNIHLYSQKVEDVCGVHADSPMAENQEHKILWHQVSTGPGPHLFQYLWWFLANQWQRRRDRIAGKVTPDLV